jgi:hypothetical protein
MVEKIACVLFLADFRRFYRRKSIPLGQCCAEKRMDYPIILTRP